MCSRCSRIFVILTDSSRVELVYCFFFCATDCTLVSFPCLSACLSVCLFDCLFVYLLYGPCCLIQINEWKNNTEYLIYILLQMYIWAADQLHIWMTHSCHVTLTWRHVWRCLQLPTRRTVYRKRPLLQRLRYCRVSTHLLIIYHFRYFILSALETQTARHQKVQLLAAISHLLHMHCRIEVGEIWEYCNTFALVSHPLSGCESCVMWLRP